jgi:hypothetical protein
MTIRDKINERHAIAGWKCEHPECNKPSQEIAHRIPKGKTGRRVVKKLWYEMFGEDLPLNGKKMDEIIHHKFNTAASCKKHNSYFVVNISNETAIFKILMDITISKWICLKK